MKFAIYTLLIAAAATGAQAITPGKWSTTGKTVDFQMQMPPGVPASVVDMIKSRMAGQSYSSSQCITRDDIDKAPEKMFSESNGQCKYDRFDMSGGKLDAVASCKMQGVRMRMEMTGTHTDTTFQTRMKMTGDGDMGPMTIISEGSGTRTGDC
ncbi:DUF3617 domain-containing protein [Pacificimonas sp. WHA3]|uniref:DUF3617 domain-containing protein n=1 Tax=Pacificimonas pallii TaxID=2827236 RepID=A0ABS6SCM9_9SPHN|nr:DUF3617 domain-containing protein [Pacificimonas pallii]MBV7256177.1 DUF3617 domain-containing protein [Pacificimonas pallii]